MNPKIFIVGPGGAGKTTSGKILARLIGYNFIDLDQEFCDHVGNVGAYIQQKGYKKYCCRNSELFFTLLGQREKDDIVFALSSGVLVHEGLDHLVQKHKNALDKIGLTILLLPSKSVEEGTEVIIERQMSRAAQGIRLKRDREEEKFRQRFPRYIELGDIQIFSRGKPEIIAEQMREKLLQTDH